MEVMGRTHVMAHQMGVYIPPPPRHMRGGPHQQTETRGETTGESDEPSKRGAIKRNREAAEERKKRRRESAMGAGDDREKDGWRGTDWNGEEERTTGRAKEA